MSEASSRRASLSPERRKLLEELLKSAARAAPEQPAVHAVSHSEGAQVGHPAKVSCQQFFDSINRQLDQTEFGSYSYFLNFGYLQDHNPHYAAVSLPEHIVNRNSARLVLEVIGDCPLENRRVLDVGCGRGGAATIVQRFFKPRSYTGVDLSGGAIAFCTAHHKLANTTFRQGDAEHLPIPDSSMDIVINIESSQSYPDIRAFYQEVFRVLRPGGYFLYTDVQPGQRILEWIGLLEASGFRLERDRDITSNVLLSCDDVARRRVAAYGVASDASIINNFLGAPGSDVYEQMRTGRWSYRVLKLRKGEGAD
jgi:phthiocerol/phenolphthiocerol synthesis type-I polyketide synthase E